MRRAWLRFGGGRGDRLRRPLDDPLTDSAAPAGMKHLERAARFDLPSQGQHHRMAGLNLLAAIVIYWNTAHFGEAVGQR